MGKSFFEYIAGLINGKQEKSPEMPETKEVAKDNSIDRQARVVDAVLKILKKNFSGQKFAFEDKNLTLWTDDGMANLLLDNDKFKNELARKLDNESGTVFAGIMVKPMPPAVKSGMTEVADGVYMTVDACRTVDAVRHAKLEVIYGCGSTLEPYYILEAGKRYNIGVGRDAVLDNGALRHNDIAVDDSLTAPQYDKNKFVSRNHARIVHDSNHGFLLFADKGGLRSSYKRTAVARGEELRNLEDTIVPFPLKDGDVIVLSKAVHLLFTEIEE